MKPFKNMTELLADHKATMSDAIDAGIGMGHGPLNVSEFERHHRELMEKAADRIRQQVAACEAETGFTVEVDRLDYDERRMTIQVVMRPVAVTENVIALEGALSGSEGPTGSGSGRGSL